MYAEERRSIILTKLQEKGRVDSLELANELETSMETIRRDLKALDERGFLLKTHGGAIAKDNGISAFNIPLKLRETQNVEEKKAICEKGAFYVAESDTIFIDNSSTSAQLIRYLNKALHITILTNSIRLLVELIKINNSNWTVICTGGTLNNRNSSLHNYLTVNNLNLFRPTKVFLSCHGISRDLRVTDLYLDDVEVKHALMASSQEKFLLADHSKINRDGTIQYARIEEFNYVITDEQANSDFLERIREQDVLVDLAGNKR